MFYNRIKSDRLSLKPFYKGFVLKETEEDCDVSRKHKIIMLRKMYFYYLKITENNDDLMIDEDSTLDEAIYYLFSEFSKFNAYDFVIINGRFNIGKAINLDYDAGYIPLEAFYDQRRKKKFYNFLLRIMAHLKSIGCSVFNNNNMNLLLEETSQRTEESSFYDEEEVKGAKVIINFYNKKITPILKEIESIKVVEFNDKEFETYALRYPKWKDFILDFKKVWENDFIFYEIHPLNIDEEMLEEGFLELDDMFCFNWSYRRGNPSNNFNELYDYYNEIYSSGGVWGEPYVTIDKSRKYDENYLRTQELKGTELLTLFTKDYECFEN